MLKSLATIIYSFLLASAGIFSLTIGAFHQATNISKYQVGREVGGAARGVW